MKQKAEDNKLGKLSLLYQKYKRWIYLVAGGALLALWYLQGTVMTIFIALCLLLSIIFIKSFWEVTRWVLKAKNEKAQQKRTLGIFITAACMVGVYFAVKYLVLPTQLGQSLQELLYKMF